MMNLYCYNSPTRSSTGFQEGLWTLRNGVCTALDPEDAAPELRGALLDGGAKALCMDTGRGTRAFLLRGIFVRQGGQSGWHMNLILEADPADHSLWADASAAFLSDYAGFTARLAELFSVEYEGGEHCVLDTEGFAALMRDAEGAAASLCTAAEAVEEPSAAQAAFHAFAETLRAPFGTDAEAQPDRLLLLVPAASVGYFMRHTALKDLSAPEICISAAQWDALLAHEDPPAEEDPEEDPEDALPSVFPEAALLAVGAIGSALVGYGLYRIVKRFRRKRKGR